MTAAQTAWGLADRCTQPRAAETRPGQLHARGCFTKVLRRKPPHPGRVRARLCELRARNARMHPCRSAHGRAPASSGETSSRSSSGQSGGFLNRRQEVRVLPGAPFSNGGPIWRARRLDPAFRRKGSQKQRDEGGRRSAQLLVQGTDSPYRRRRRGYRPPQWDAAATRSTAHAPTTPVRPRADTWKGVTWPEAKVRHKTGSTPAPPNFTDAP